MKRILWTVLLALPLAADVKLTKETNRVAVAIDGQPFTEFFFGPDTMKPYLHPLRTADGTVVTRRYPMERVEGETRDHPHHQGLWFTHGDVNGFDFWANAKPGPKMGKVVLRKLGNVKSGGNKGSVEAEFTWQDPSGKSLLTERRVMTFHSHPVNRMLDVDVTLTALDAPVKFGDTKEGTFAIRISDQLTEKSKGGQMVSSSGAAGMRAVWGKPFPWVDYSGKLGDKAVGIAILDHPSNPGHPTHWHSRDYGLFAANIFGHHDFYSDKLKDGSAILEPGKSMRFRYRVVIHPGSAADAKIEALYKDWAK